MPYEPFERGPFPVGVRHFDWNDDGWEVSSEIWFWRWK